MKLLNVGCMRSVLLARSYQFTENYKRVVTLKFSTNTAINYTTCYSLPLLLISFSGGRTSAFIKIIKN